MLIGFGLLCYAIAPIAAFFLKRRKKEEGQIWLVFLAGALLGSLLIFLNPLSSAQSDSPLLWFSSNAMLIPVDMYWEKSGWVLAQCIALFILVFVVKNYRERETRPIPFRSIVFFIYTGIFSILLLSLHKEFVVAIILLGLDGLRLWLRFARNEEIFSARGSTISLLLRLISIVLLILLASLLDGGITDAAFHTLCALMIGIIFLRVGANGIDQSSVDRTVFREEAGWLLFLECLILLRGVTFFPLHMDIPQSDFLILFLFCEILLFFLTYVWVNRSKDKWDYWMASAFALILGVFISILGVRQEISYLALPVFFLLLNGMLQNGKKEMGSILLILESIFLLGFSFSPFYSLNKALLAAQSTSWILYSAFLFEGFYFAGFVITQRRMDERYPRGNMKKALLNNIPLGCCLAGLILIIGKGFLPMDGINQIEWITFLPLIPVIIVWLAFIGKRRSSSGGSAKKEFLNGSSSRFIEKITDILLGVGDVFRQIFEAISAVLEREGGLIWAIIFLILLLTLFRGLSS